MSNLGVPKEDRLDKIHSLVKLIGGLLPGGGTAMELWSMIVKSPISIRRDQFLELLFEEVKNQGKTVIGILGRVEKMEEFESMVIEAVVIAAKTHQKEKHRMLRDAVINGVKSDMLYDLKQIFINFIDSLTVQHIHLLQYLDLYKNYIRDNRLNSFEVFYNLLVAGKDSREGPVLEYMSLTAFRFLMIDLQAKGLLFISNSIGEVDEQVFHSQMLSTGNSGTDDFSYVQVSEFGRDFLAFIREGI